MRERERERRVCTLQFSQNCENNAHQKTREKKNTNRMRV
jgi:hypothetical protein